MEGKRVLVVSAHAADYVWRSGGTIAKYIKHGANVDVVVLSFGVRGESAAQWKKEGATYDTVKQNRLEETTKAAEILGVKNIEFWDLPDYPMRPYLTEDIRKRMVKKIREVRPDIIITHDKKGKDILNPDHNDVSEFVFECSIHSNSRGVIVDNLPTTKQMRLFGFEPHQTELSQFVPDELVDITEVYEQKVAAMQCFQAQHHLIQYYTERANLRGNHLRRISGNQTYKYGEAFSSFFPIAGDELV
ncbi:PIG-L deacetylase family protein [Veillonella ratti]|uniref:PIG-L deacetylase family protein n=1 Tax=Veillonella ratti TaxID=103892 RepID=UPI0025E59E79|nr:PIG-L deacetylase family protein [Veillonella ratti]